ncbi:MAG: sugar kinase [Cyanobacteria bacterium P01_H01_bin.74]
MVELYSEGSLVSTKSFIKSYGGDTLNTAIAAARLGSSVSYITRLGDDIHAAGLRDMIVQEGVALEAGRIFKGKTGLYMVSVSSDSEREFAYYRENSAACQLCPQDISPQLIQSGKIIFASGITMAISQSARESVIKAFKIAKAAGIITALDPNYRENLWLNSGKMVDALNEILPLVDVLLPSFPEDTEAIISFKRPEQALQHFMLKGVPLVIIKAGNQGCYIGYRNEVTHVPAMAIKAIDTTGAGDAFNAGFLHGLARQESLVQCAKLGVTTAALKVLNKGSALAMPNKDSVYSRAFAK